MKKALMVLLVSAGCTVCANAQSLKESAVPSATKEAFQKQYPNTPAKWEKEKSAYEVNFKKDNKTMSAVIDKSGVIMETETDIAINELPKNVQKYLKSHYKNKRVTEAAKIVKANGQINYEGEVNGKDVIFDESGKFLKEAKD